MDDTFIIQRAESILRECKLGVFPLDYLDSKAEYREIALPVGTDIFLYRETEGVNLVIDGNKMYFNERQVAKYCFYCAVMGYEKIQIPDVVETFEIVKRFEGDLQSASSIISELRKKMFIQDFYKMKDILEEKNPSFKIIFYEWGD
ncbi:MAG: hypothetical protein M1375_03820 [Candidatus Thermoplasmatota archaeon]|jgi:hypothetical protein|nr:hypothetical protein [Candidatus Thermoplasmatota archaeon]MCL5791081.1 hypothetical protein [Candidatus Thermoplasmatota archaeon]